jgi:transcription elongation GreA/GreB family factor
MASASRYEGIGALLQQSSIIDVRKSQGLGAIRYRVISATDRNATAEIDGDNDTSAIDIGNLATFIEDDSDAASARRFKRKRLP